MNIEKDFTQFEHGTKNIDYDELCLYQQDREKATSRLRFWECQEYVVVLGRSNQAEKEVYVERCHQDGVAIVKRCSGGGAVLQGKGCLNYSFILMQSLHKDLRYISSTNTWIMTHLKQALSPLVKNLYIRGATDVCLGHKKCSGNAQRRLRHALLFHGSLLYQFDLSKISWYLKHPSTEPAYRQQRSHHDFLCNLNIKKQDLIQQISHYFDTLCLK